MTTGRPDRLEPGAAIVRRDAVIALIAVAGIAAHLVLRFALHTSPAVHTAPLIAVLAIGGAPLVIALASKLLRREFGSDLLAGASIVTAALLGEYLAGALVVLMLSGGQALEAYAVGRASSVLLALSRRMPSVAHRRGADGLEDVPLDNVRVDDVLTIFPHEVSPVDGVVIDGHGIMDESYLTGEPFMMSKAPGSEVISGAINGEQALVVRASRLAVDSRYAKIMEVMRESEQARPSIRRLGDQLGAIYTPIAVAIAASAWAASGDPVRFLAVLVVATPCPLLIGIPVAIIGSISLAAKRSIIIRNPAVLEQIDTCRTIVLDKTGTLTYGQPTLTDVVLAPGEDETRVLQLAASVERYSKHPLAPAIVHAAETRDIALLAPSQFNERPGEGIDARVDRDRVRIVGRKRLTVVAPRGAEGAPREAAGLECMVILNDDYAATFRFHDAAREDSRPFIDHLGPRHQFDRVLLVSGDRREEVSYLAERVGITEVHAGCSPEEKVAITRDETSRAPTLFIGDGINDAPALVTATVGIAFGHRNEITAEAAGAVIMDTSLVRVDELFHISRRMRAIALQSAVGGMALSIVGMLFAFGGYLPPVAGAVFQEVIDLAAVLNALRAAVPGRTLTDF